MDNPQEFMTRRQRRELKRLERKRGEGARVRRPKWLWLVLVLLVAGAGVWWFSSRPTLTAAEQAAKAAQETRNVALSCTTDMATTFHIHTHLTITINGEDREVPADTGITAGCMHPLHTHDSTGIIHIESPVQRDFTLGDFFAVWKTDFTSSKILDTTIEDTHQMKFFVNGTEASTGAETVMRAHDSYAIIVSPIGETITPPANYTFPTGE